MSYLVSVVICTYNRSSFLQSALDSLLVQTDSDFEMLIIDNNSSDDTHEIVKSYSQRSSRIKYFLEIKQGLSHARNRGIKEATGSYIAYVDDDCIIPTAWIENLKNIIAFTRADILGGPVFPFYLKNTSSWFKDEYHTFEFGPTARMLAKSETLIGCNMVVLKSIFDEIGLFRADLGMTGNQILYSEETEFQLRYIKSKANNGIYYDPLLYVKHYLRPEKMTLSWNIRAFIGKGKSNFLKDNSKAHSKINIITLLKLISSILKLSLLISYGLVFRSRNKYPYFENYVMERLAGNFKKVGFLLAQF